MYNMSKQISPFKRILSTLISSAVIISCIPSVSAAKSETADAAVSAMTAGWNLGNTLDSCGEWIGLYTQGLPSDYETAWGNPITQKKMITAVKNAGFNSVRVPVTWSEHIDDKGNIDKKWLDRVQETVDYVISQDMYCILNVHHDAGSDCWLEASDCGHCYFRLFCGRYQQKAD
ncbi:MAG: cellulase family glycosylhydrolase [Oscillospiraceae bacterium]|nr:cellulase family glycosylhydrolase [Oscillospiraceae bacterium]